MIDPFWHSVIEAYDQVSTHPHVKARVARDQRMAVVHWEPSADVIVITVSKHVEAGRLPTIEELG